MCATVGHSKASANSMNRKQARGSSQALLSTTPILVNYLKSAISNYYQRAYCIIKVDSLSLWLCANIWGCVWNILRYTFPVRQFKKKSDWGWTPLQFLSSSANATTPPTGEQQCSTQLNHCHLQIESGHTHILHTLLEHSNKGWDGVQEKHRGKIWQKHVKITVNTKTCLKEHINTKQMNPYLKCA